MKKSVYKQYFNYLFSHKIFLIVVLFQVILITSSTVFFTNCEYTGFQLLYLFSRWNYLFCVLLSVMAFYLFIAAIKAQCSEAVDAISNVRFTWQKGLYKVFAVVWMLMHVIWIGMIVYCSIKNDGTNYFLSYFPKAYLINIVLPQIIFIEMAYVCSCVYEKNKIVSLSILTMFYIMTSSLLERLIWREQPGGLPIDQVVKKIRWLFSILYQNAIWSPDTQYGLQTEKVRVYLTAFWLLFLIGIGGWVRSKKRIMSKICVMLSLFLLILSYSPSSLYRLNESWDGIFKDLTYYSKENILYHQNQYPEYQFTKYDLEIDISGRLLVTGKLTLHSSQPRREYVFTLYHGYQIQNLVVNDLEVEYKHEEDKVTMVLEKPTENADVLIVYKGEAGKFYSNSEGIMLPGYFPWYPMAGEKQVFVQYSGYNGGNGYNPYNRIIPAEFILEINSDCAYITNLEKVEGNTYSGICDSLTLIGGNISLTSENKIKNYLPLELCQTNEAEYLSDLNKQWERTLNELENVFGIDVSELSAKEIILASKDIGRNFSNSFFVEFQDYILTSDLYMDSGTYINYLLYRQEKESEIGDLLCRVLLTNENKSADAIVEEMIVVGGNNSQVIEDLEGYEHQSMVTENLLRIREKIGSERLLKEIIIYLLNKPMMSDELFWETLGNSFQ